MPIDVSKLDPEGREWVESLPEPTRKIFDHYPPGRYRVKPGAPYGLTAPGCIVGLVSYSEGEEVEVVVLEATEAAQRHHMRLRDKHQAQFRAPDTVVGSSAAVDPQWLELIELAPGAKAAWVDV